MSIIFPKFPKLSKRSFLTIELNSIKCILKIMFWKKFSKSRLGLLIAICVLIILVFYIRAYTKNFSTTYSIIKNTSSLLISPTPTITPLIYHGTDGSTCIDSDPSNDITIKGYCKDDQGIYYDDCSKDLQATVEHSCVYNVLSYGSDGKPNRTKYNCGTSGQFCRTCTFDGLKVTCPATKNESSTHMYCSNAVCVYSVPSLTPTPFISYAPQPKPDGMEGGVCFDSDGAINLEWSGYCKDAKGIHYDTCLDDETANDYSCEYNIYGSGEIECHEWKGYCKDAFYDPVHLKPLKPPHSFENRKCFQGGACKFSN